MLYNKYDNDEFLFDEKENSYEDKRRTERKTYGSERG